VNAVYDATGVRFRELPLTPERVRAALGKQAAKPAEPKRSRLPSLGAIAATVVGLLGLGAVAMPIHSEIAPISRPDPATWSAATIEKGRLLAALGACVICHTADGGVAYAGGRPLPTPFGTVIATNITPDVETGIGAWSYPAFERAMRQGIHRDGHNLYPAFPYPSFTQASEEDLQALYAYLMSQPAVRQINAASTLAFPFNLRPLVSAWNWLFNRAPTHTAVPARSAEWNRGRYLVDGLGHCGACHTPRNLLGAERAAAYLAGGVVEGWDAPALTGLSIAPLPWTEDALFTYLRTGTSPDHGAAAGPMGPIVRELKALPDNVIRAMAIYLASFSTPLPAAEAQVHRAELVSSTGSTRHPPTSVAARLYEGACGACHDPERIALSFNVGPPLALNSTMRADRPDNFLRVLLEGIAETPHGNMPAFRTTLDDAQMADLARYARARFAPSRPAWENLEDAVARLRAAPPSPTSMPAM